LDVHCSSNEHGAILLEKLIAAQLVKKFPVFHETHNLVTVFVRGDHWFLLWASWIHSTPNTTTCYTSPEFLIVV